MEYRHQLPGPAREGRRPPRDVERRHRPRRGARREGDPRRDRDAAAPRRRSPGCARAGRWSASRTTRTAVQQMALEWGVLPLLMPSTADVEDLWARTIETARASGRRRRRRPRRARRRHRGQPVRLDERDQGRRRLSRPAGGAAGRAARTSVHACCARPGCSRSAALVRRRASSTGSRSTPTCTRATCSTGGRPRWRGSQPQQQQLEARIDDGRLGPRARARGAAARAREAGRAALHRPRHPRLAQEALACAG